MYEQVKIKEGLYKGFNGVIIGENAIKKTYRIILEANGCIVVVPISNVGQTIGLSLNNLSLEESDYNILNQGNDYVYNNSSDSPFEKDMFHDIANLNDTQNADLSNFLNQEFKQGYQEIYNLVGDRSFKELELKYSNESKQVIENIYNFLKDISELVGIQPISNENQFYLAHTERILKFFKTLETKNFNLDKSNPIILKDFVSSYMYIYSNNTGIRERYNLAVNKFLEKYSLKNTNLNYLVASLQFGEFYNKRPTNNGYIDYEKIKNNFDVDLIRIQKIADIYHKIAPKEYNLISEEEQPIQTNIKIQKPQQIRQEDIKREALDEGRKQLLREQNIKRLERRKKTFQGLLVVSKETNITHRIKQNDNNDLKRLSAEGKLRAQEKYLVRFNNQLNNLVLNDQINKNGKEVLIELINYSSSQNLNKRQFFSDFEDYIDYLKSDNLKPSENNKILNIFEKIDNKILKKIILTFFEDTQKLITNYSNEYTKKVIDALDAKVSQDYTKDLFKSYRTDYVEYTYFIAKGQFLELYKSRLMKDKISANIVNNGKYLINNFDSIINDSTFTKNLQGNAKDIVESFKKEFNSQLKYLLDNENNKNNFLEQLRIKLNESKNINTSKAQREKEQLSQINRQRLEKRTRLMTQTLLDYENIASSEKEPKQLSDYMPKRMRLLELHMNNTQKLNEQNGKRQRSSSSSSNSTITKLPRRSS